MKDGTVKDGTVKASTVKAGTMNEGTVKAGTVKEGTVKGTAEGEKWMLKEPNMDAGVGLEIDARMGAKRVFRYNWASPYRIACAIIRILLPLLRMEALAK